MSTQITLSAIPQMPHIHPGDDVAELTLAAMDAADITLRNGDVLAVAQKIVSKSEGRQVKLATVVPSVRAREVASETGKDPRLVELVLQEGSEISRMREGLIIVRHRLGFTCANAGIDRSNVSQEDDEDTVLLLPSDPDHSAQKLREDFRRLSGAEVGIVITDSHGRPFRLGTVGVAIGVAGLPALWDRRGDEDLFGYELQHTEVGVADEIAAAAGLLMGQANEGIPVVHFRGLDFTRRDGVATDLVRSKAFDLYI